MNLIHILFLAFLMSSPGVFAEEEIKIKSSIEPVLGNVDGGIELPKQIPYLKWDPKGIQLIRKNVMNHHYVLKMRGSIPKHQVESFSYQVEQSEAKKIKLKDRKFDIEIPIEKSPTEIRLWIEVAEGKAVKIYSDLLKIQSEVSQGGSAEKKVDF